MLTKEELQMRENFYSSQNFDDLIPDIELPKNSQKNSDYTGADIDFAAVFDDESEFNFTLENPKKRNKSSHNQKTNKLGINFNEPENQIKNTEDCFELESLDGFGLDDLDGFEPENSDNFSVNASESSDLKIFFKPAEKKSENPTFNPKKTTSSQLDEGLGKRKR
jgi:hypothetical protein